MAYSRTKYEYEKKIPYTDAHGVRKYKHVVAHTKEEFDNKVLELKIAERKGIEQAHCDKFGYWAEQWYEDKLLRRDISEHQVQTYRSAIRVLNARFEDVSFKNIPLNEFQKFINELADENPHTHKPTSRKTLYLYINTAEQIASYASDSKVEGVCNFDHTEIPKSATKTVRKSISLEQFQMILDTRHRAQPFTMIACLAGLRRSEILGLQWRDVDLDNSTISVCRTVNFINNRPVLKEGGKTRNATRTVKIPPALKSYLQEYRSRLPAVPLPRQLVCCREDGTVFTESTYQRMWESYMKCLNRKYGDFGKAVIREDDVLPMKIEPFTLHQCRHFFATLCYLQGMSPVDTMQQMGHADIQTTFNIYTDLDQFHKFDLPRDFQEKLMTVYHIDIAGHFQPKRMWNGG